MVIDGQLSLDVEEPFALVAVAPDGAILARVPVEGGPGAPWRAAECWCYLAHVEDRRRRPWLYGEARQGG